MKKSKIKIGLVLVALLAFTNSCKEDFLNVTPNGSLDAQVLATAEGVDALLISAYSMVDGVASNGFGWEAASSNWVYGSIRGLEANKGTDAGDQPDINPIQTYAESATNPYLNIKWRSVYDGVSRCNSVLQVLETAVANGTVSAAQETSFRKQARVLRGLYHFEAWRMWAKADGTGIPYVDETTDPVLVTNDADVRDLILADLQEGTTLDENMGQIGRFNSTVSKVLYAKALMQMKKDFAGAKTILASIVGANGAKLAAAKKPDGSAIGLEAKYGDIFDASKRNGLEAIYTVQYSVNDGSGGWNAGWGEVLNFPYKSGASPGGCCGFFQPSHDFANSFRTDASGFPFLDNSYNSAANALTDDQGKVPADAYTPDTRSVDPRLDWTVGRRGITYLDWGVHTGSDWIRDQSYAGPYTPMKQVYKKSQEGQLTEVGNWTSGWTANGYRLIRYADVLLLLAECQIETNDLAGALANINAVRNRAANPAGFVVTPGVSVTYNVAPYTTLGTQDNARTILRFERKLELGMEGHRFFDLQRWGTVQTELNRILDYEKTRRSSLYGGASVGPEDVNYPIPQNQIDITNGKLKQNR
ncbi:MAG: RagB/SusD family nutrient uptake outer membrane protein [Cyclobacteriaceae bacterium]|nr:RagB/SusD family nutrient uptake outer membrane protein [Cyclobacteriaceae bacterium]